MFPDSLLQHIAELVQAMWSEVGFKALIHLYEDTVPYKKPIDAVVEQVQEQFLTQSWVLALGTAERLAGDCCPSSPLAPPPRHLERLQRARASHRLLALRAGGRAREEANEECC
jgi:hypothetical protein